MLKNLFKTVIAVAFIVTATNAQGLECSEPKAFVESVKTTVLGVLDSSKDDASKKAELDATFRNVMDIDWMGKFVLGRTYSTLTPAQQKEYTVIYGDYTSASYVERFKEYNGEEIVTNGVKPINSDFAVDTTINRKGKAPISVTYRIRKSGSCFKVADIVAEGVSLINTQRQEFSSVIGRDGFDGLLKLLKAKTEQYKSQ